MNAEREGGCTCGAVRYRLASDPMFIHCCHCLNCQRQTGSAFVLNALIEADRVTLLSGNLEPVAVPTDSGRSHEISNRSGDRPCADRRHAKASPARRRIGKYYPVRDSISAK